MPEPKARQIARNWWMAHLEDADVVDVKKAAKVAADELLADDWFRETFLEEFLVDVLYRMGLNMLANTRAELRTKEGIRAQLAKDIERSDIKWSDWREFDPTTGQHISLPLMTKEQLEAASNYRMRLADSLRVDATWLKALAASMEPGQRVEEVFDDGMISRIRRICGG